MAINICLFGGPGTGKSTTAAGLFYTMKTLGYKVEYVTEYAKDLVFSKDFYRLKDQLYILAKQHHAWFKLDDQVDYLVHDSPFIIGSAYLHDNKHLPSNMMEDLIVEMYKSYETLNIFLQRSDYHPYQEYGRNQTLEEAIELDNKIKAILNDNDIPFYTVSIDENTISTILGIVSELEELNEQQYNTRTTSTD